MLDWLNSVPEEGYLIVGMLLQMTVLAIMHRFKWSSAHMLPVTRRLVRAAGWKGVLASLGLSLVPDALVSPVGLVKGIARRAQEDTPAERRARIREARKNPGTVIITQPKNLQEAMLNSLLRGNVAQYHLEQAPGEPTKVHASLILEKGDTPWLM